MRLLMISDVYFPRVNGVSTSIQTTRHAMESLGHEVTLLCPDYPLPHQDEGKTLRIPARKVIFDPEDRLMRWNDLMRMTEGLRRERFDLLHIHTPFAAHYAGVRIARGLGLPVVETYHTFFEQYLEHYIPVLPGGLLRMLARRLTVSQGRAVDALISPSCAMRDRLLSYGVPSPIEIIPTGIDLDAWRTPQAADPRPSLGLNAEQPMLLFVGRLAFEKNIGFLLQMLHHVIRKHPDASLVIAGEGPAEAELRASVDRQGLQRQVRFVGNISRAGELQALYRAANAFVFASTTETQGLVLVEAMALGVPVIALAEMGTRDIVHEGEGCLVAPNDPAGFANRVNELLEHPRLAAHLAAKAVIHAEQWQEMEVAKRLVAFYRGIVNNTRIREDGLRACE